MNMYDTLDALHTRVIRAVERANPNDLSDTTLLNVFVNGRYNNPAICVEIAAQLRDANKLTLYGIKAATFKIE